MEKKGRICDKCTRAIQKNNVDARVGSGVYRPALRVTLPGGTCGLLGSPRDIAPEAALRCTERPHVKGRARMVPSARLEMAVQYPVIVSEHRAVRARRRFAST